MAISATSATSAVSASSSSATAIDAKTIAGNFDKFLQLLTTQLKNQNPLDPLNTNEFTQQLVQFSGVEQQLKTNDLLNKMVTQASSSNTTAALGFVGATVTADGSSAPLANNKATWSLDAARDAKSAKLTIKDSSGSVVATKTTTLQAGVQTFTWNGVGSTGAPAADGAYTLTVDATDVSGRLVSVTLDVSGVVDSVDVTGATPILKIGSLSIPSTKVKTLSRS